MTLPLRVVIGRSLSSATVRGLALTVTKYSRSPIFCVPAGRIEFCAPIAAVTSLPERPVARSASGSRSTWTCRCRPP
jgi:hypothetical protein